MKRVSISIAVLAAVAAGGVALKVATRTEPICELHTVFAPCADLQTLHGAENVPACEDAETVGAVLAVRLIGEETAEATPDTAPQPLAQPAPLALLAGWLQPPGLVRKPIDCSAYAWPSDEPEDRVAVVPVQTMHADSIAGTVARNATGTGEFTTPAEAPHVGYCYGAGCYCAAEPCEYVAIGSSDPMYWQKRLCRMYPEAEGCVVQEPSSAP